LSNVYQAPGIAAAVNFQLHAAIRTCSGSFDCPDEDSGCTGTKYVLCALQEVAGESLISKRIGFLSCWDDTVTGQGWETAARKCASSEKLDFGKISACATGSQGTTLQTAAAKAFITRFPSHQCGNIFGVPNIEINGKEQSSHDYDALLKNLCATNITAGACQKATTVATLV